MHICQLSQVKLILTSIKLLSVLTNNDISTINIVSANHTASIV